MVCPRTDKAPPTNPVLKRNVMLELSVLAEMIVVLAGLVQRNTLATVCEVVGAGTIAVYVIVLLIHALYEPVEEEMPKGVGGRYCKAVL
ncbi:MAG: hypothetical protein EB101_13100, partial [Chitinophagia bacterium]|nr:hypothetical protein [Chitinophagia bacterium]